MEICLYNGKEICAYDLKDENGYYKDESVLKWKLAAAEGKLSCIECGEKVYLASGQIKEPYFAHYSKTECTYGDLSESEESKTGKRLLYSLLKKSFPEGEIHARYKMKNGMYSSCYVENLEGQDLAIDYRLQNSEFIKFNERDKFYKSEGIIPIYILGIRLYKDTKQLQWFQSLIQRSISYCAFIDVWEEKILLKKRFDNIVGKRRDIRSCQMEYPIKDITIDKNGFFICDFEQECNKIEKLIQEEQVKYELINNRDNRISMSNEGIRQDILKAAIECVARGEAHLVSKKYLDFILKNDM